MFRWLIAYIRKIFGYGDDSRDVEHGSSYLAVENNAASVPDDVLWEIMSYVDFSDCLDSVKKLTLVSSTFQAILHKIITHKDPKLRNFQKALRNGIIKCLYENCERSKQLLDDQFPNPAGIMEIKKHIIDTQRKMIIPILNLLISSLKKMIFSLGAVHP